MLYGIDTKQDKDIKEFHQRVADRNIQGIDDGSDEILQAKHGYLGILGGIIVGGLVGWLFLGPSGNINAPKTIPIIRRPITPAKVQPNDPGGMEIDNQDREIYHIVDNTPKEVKKVNIRPVPDMPKMVVENQINNIDNMDELVESIGESNNFNSKDVQISSDADSVQTAKNELVGIKTNSNKKISIPKKITDVEVKLQKSIKRQGAEIVASETQAEPAKEIKNQETKIVPQKSIKGTWYAQIIASSSRKAVQILWNKLSVKHKYLKEYPHEIEEITSANGNTLYRLKIGTFKTRADASKLGGRLKKDGISSIIKQN